MRVFACGAAVIAALAIWGGVSAADAQDVTLIARDGALELSGTLQSFDGEFYRILSAYGPLTVDAQGVICDGPGCPGLTAPRAVIRMVGEGDPGARILPGLMRAFADFRRLTLEVGSDATRLTDPATDQVLAEFTFAAMPVSEALPRLDDGRADLVVAAAVPGDGGSRTLALDALVPIVAADNPVAKISSADRARVLGGEVTNWDQVGGPDMPLVLHALPPESGVQQALGARLGRSVKPAEVHPDLTAVAEAVARDPWAIAVTGRSSIGTAKPITLTDKCGFPLLPTSLAVKAEDYPLALPIHLLTPKRRLPLIAREFLEFLSYPQAQTAIAQSGFVDRQPERQPMTTDGQRLINAIQGAGAETTLEDLKVLVDAMDGADRLSLTFRFEDGSTTLDAASRDNLSDLALLLEAGMFKGESLILAGFSDGSGPAAANLDLSRQRAEAVAAGLAAAAPTVPPERLPKLMAFGEALPMACDETATGRRLNRRVELWLRPDFTKDLAPGN